MNQTPLEGKRCYLPSSRTGNSFHRSPVAYAPELQRRGTAIALGDGSQPGRTFGSQGSPVLPMLCAPCSMLYALCSMLYALCPLPSSRTGEKNAIGMTIRHSSKNRSASHPLHLCRSVSNSSSPCLQVAPGIAAIGSQGSPVLPMPASRTGEKEYPSESCSGGFVD
jgi:hypothetical protein